MMGLWRRIMNTPEKGTQRAEAREALTSAEAELARVQRQAPLVEAYANRFQLHLAENTFSERAREAMRRIA